MCKHWGSFLSHCIWVNNRISEQEYEGCLNFATDAWTSPNHKAYVAVTVHLEHAGKPFSMVLDIVEVAASHTGSNLAQVFVSILKDFGISNKVSNVDEKSHI
jgi:hypothetical protein